jgi:transposase-like protein
MPRRSTDHLSAASSRARRLVGAELERCIFCQGTAITREGKRYKKLETVQLWYCRTCDRVFTPKMRRPMKPNLEMARRLKGDAAYGY